MSLEPLVGIGLPSYLLDVLADHELARRVEFLLDLAVVL